MKTSDPTVSEVLSLAFANFDSAPCVLCARDEACECEDGKCKCTCLRCTCTLPMADDGPDLEAM